MGNSRLIEMKYINLELFFQPAVSSIEVAPYKEAEM